MKAVKEHVRNSPGLSFCFQERSEPLSFSWHYHQEYELTLIIKGRGKRFIGDDIAEYRSLDMVLIGPNLPHAFESPDSLANGCRTIIVQFQPSLFSAGWPQAGEFRNIHRLLNLASNGLEFDAATVARVLPIVEASIHHAGLYKLLDIMRVLDIISTEGRWRTIASDWNRVDSDNPGLPGPRADGQILQYVFANAHRPLTLERISGYAGMSIATTCRFFKKTVGCTFNEYLSRIRISNACKLLIQTNLPVYSVSYESGFENLSNFNRRFLRSKGMTPSAYRKLHRKNSRHASTEQVESLG